MKKIYMLIPLLFLLVGCTNIENGYLEKTCTKTTFGDIDLIETYKIDFKDNKIGRILYSNKYVFNKIELKDAMVKGFNDLTQTFNEDNVTINGVDEDNSYTLTYDYNVTKLSKDSIKEYHLDSTYNRLKSTLEDNGFTCK